MVPVRKSNRRRGETAISGERIAEGEGRRNGRIRSSDVACLSFMGIRTMRSKTQSRHGWAFRLEHHRLDIVACLSFMGTRTMRSKPQSRHGWAFCLEHHRMKSIPRRRCPRTREQKCPQANSAVTTFFKDDAP